MTESSEESSLKQFYRAWAWKREHRPDKERFHRPYKHTMVLPETGEQLTLSIKQSKFVHEGFASTVWDSSIVMAKFCEKWAARFKGKRVLDLSAGCGLVGVVLSKLGAEVVLTDLAPNLPLLRDNCKMNGCGSVTVLEHEWGRDPAALRPPFDYILACDVMYIAEAVPALLRSLEALSDASTQLVVAHGRNRFAEAAFMEACRGRFAVEVVGGSELDEVYQCSDVDVFRLRRLR